MCIAPGSGIRLSFGPVVGVGLLELGDGKGEIHIVAVWKPQSFVEMFQSHPTGVNTFPKLHIPSPVFNDVKELLKAGGPSYSTITEGT